MGQVAFNLTNQKLRSSGNASMTSAGQRITSVGIERVSDHLSQWLQDQYLKSSRGRPNGAYLALKDINPHVVAVLALRTALDSCCIKRTSYQGIATKIGRVIQDEEHFRAFSDQAKGLFKWSLAQSSHVSDKRRVRTVVIWTANRAGIQWTPWSEDLMLRVGTVLIEILVRSTGILQVHTAPGGSRKRGIDDSWYVSATAGTSAWIAAHNAEQQLLCPVKMPTIIPPKPWTSPFDGGYWSPNMPNCPLVKTNKAAYLRELEALNPTAVYDAVNRLQNTAWQVNQWVLDVVKDVWRGGDELAGLPPEEDPEFPPKPSDIDTNERARKAYRCAAAAVWERIMEIRPERAQAKQILSVAERFRDHKAIYMPYQLDFRGRVYAQPSSLQPQGCDLAKGLLRFAEGKPLATPEAIRWWMIHGANTYGIDKVSFDDRVAWVKENHDMIVRVGTDPRSNREWCDADSPFMFLAWAQEYTQWTWGVSGFVSHLPVFLDGSCSGLQHLSAMLRDPIGGKSVNLIPSDKPQDIYADVAKLVMAKLQAMPNEHLAQLWAAYLVDRKTCKRPVMTYTYGATLSSHRQFILDAIKERVKEGKPHPFGDDAFGASVFLAKVVWEAIGETVVAARSAMDWLQEAAKATTASGLAINWVTPSGFPVMQAYPQMEGRFVKLSLGDKVRQITLTREKDELDKRRQTAGISPNFVHSCDAAALVLAVTKAGSLGVGSIACVHDSFGTHAADTELFAQTIRTTFSKMYRDHDVLGDFKSALESVGVILPELPPKGSLDIGLVSGSLYSFA